ncbi:MAG: hypothetical protein ACYCUM_06090 [Solirubrobacteraceae bacterium]
MCRAPDTDTAARASSKARESAAQDAACAAAPSQLDVAGSSRDQLEAEVRRLGKRLSELERELVDVQAEANAAVARWQERAYWLDRWHLDLNALMERPGAAELRAMLRAVRSVLRFFKHAKRRLRS